MNKGSTHSWWWCGILLVTLLLLLGCGSEKPDGCETAADCGDGESCLWVANAGQCAVRCGANSDCLLGQFCTGKAASCNGCLDIATFCE